MVNLATVLSVAASLTSVNAQAPAPKPAPLPSGTVIVKVIQKQDGDRAKTRAKAYDGNYDIDGEFSQDTKVSPDEKYAEMKKKLDERFAYMFELKKEMDEQNQLANAKWEEYYALREAYERQLKKIIADWVTEQNYA